MEITIKNEDLDNAFNMIVNEMKFNVKYPIKTEKQQKIIEKLFEQESITFCELSTDSKSLFAEVTDPEKRYLVKRDLPVKFGLSHIPENVPIQEKSN